MKRNFKKFLAVFMAAVMVIAAGRLPARAESADCAYIDGKTPSYSYTVTGDVNVITANVTFAPANDPYSFNDWCGYCVAVTHVDGSKSYYQFGGKEVNWGVDLDGDEKNDTFGVNGGTWLGNVDGETLTATLGIPAEKGAVVDFIVTAWDSYTGKQFSVDITEGGEATVSGGVKYIDGKTPGSTYTVQNDCNSVIIDVEYLASLGETFGYNDWCQNGIIITHTDGSKSYYQWGGKEVNWDWKEDGADAAFSVGGVTG
ncbi:MAG: hypothetical protein J6X17_00970, partial [Lachnospiraceae bacterium]|nr:hypothetical protein [Lachnospiraceae bacterium]